MSMTIADFWNHAFLAALHRLPVAEAKLEASAATEACLSHWHEQRYDKVPVWQRRRYLGVTEVVNNAHIHEASFKKNDSDSVDPAPSRRPRGTRRKARR